MSFNERVWNICRKIPKGRVTTYKLVAEALGSKAYRAVGNALNRNPDSSVIPCHRIVKSDGSLGGFARGAVLKKKMLEKEGIKISEGKVAGFSRVLFRFRK
ncbi:MAG: MGMT family protein [Candidatus Woesearchaeota archaeon]